MQVIKACTALAGLTSSSTVVCPTFHGVTPEGGTAFHIKVNPGTGTWSISVRRKIRLSPDAPWAYLAATFTVDNTDIAADRTKMTMTDIACAEAAVEITALTPGTTDPTVDAWIGF